MSQADWERVITDGVHAGVERVQFIGGEPTLYPALPALVDHTLGLGCQVEIYTNLLDVTPEMGALFSRPGVRLGASYYSGTPAEHEAITRKRGSYAQTKANIAEVVARGIKVRIGMVEMLPGQDIAGAYRDLREMGLTDDDIRLDQLRLVGRGAPVGGGEREYCGRCVRGQVAVLPTGDVHACVLSREEAPVGNVLRQSLATILTGTALQVRRRELSVFDRPEVQACDPGNGCFPPPRVFPAGIDSWNG
jgi:MoaA/NifB/PqqE/SkfB family radical SAM enzyme